MDVKSYLLFFFLVLTRLSSFSQTKFWYSSKEYMPSSSLDVNTSEVISRNKVRMEVIYYFPLHVKMDVDSFPISLINYDQWGQPTKIKHYNKANELESIDTFVYDDKHRLIRKNEINLTTSTFVRISEFSYDSLGRAADDYFYTAKDTDNVEISHREFDTSGRISRIWKKSFFGAIFVAEKYYYDKDKVSRIEELGWNGNLLQTKIFEYHDNPFTKSTFIQKDEGTIKESEYTFDSKGVCVHYWESVQLFTTKATSELTESVSVLERHDVNKKFYSRDLDFKYNSDGTISQTNVTLENMKVGMTKHRYYYY